MTKLTKRLFSVPALVGVFVVGLALLASPWFWLLFLACLVVCYHIDKNNGVSND